MYLRTGQYPAFRGKTPKQQRQIASAAIGVHGKRVSHRFWSVVASLFGSAFLLGLFAPEDLPSWYTWIAALCMGIAFYGYLLFEINGPIHRAVQLYLGHET
jgi:hypothetical protein